jgi:hypothetical protein
MKRSSLQKERVESFTGAYTIKHYVFVFYRELTDFEVNRELTDVEVS